MKLSEKLKALERRIAQSNSIPMFELKHDLLDCIEEAKQLETKNENYEQKR